ncbi:MAG: IclR family transcriptional regulator [Halocynthiibacter sp.]
MAVNRESENHFGMKARADDAGPTAVHAEGNGGGRLIQSVSRALTILEVLAAEREGLTLSELAERAGLNSSTCHHLVATLVARGYLTHLGRSRGYALGQKLHELNILAGREADPAEMLKDDLRKLGERLGHGVQLAVLSETSLLTKLRFSAPNEDLEQPDEVAKMTALHATATGKAILAWIPDTELVRIVSANGLDSYTARTITTLSGLVEELRLVRRRGYSVDVEEFQDGVVCIGAALREVGGAVVASISVTVAAEKATEECRAHLSKAIISAAHEFSIRLRKIQR